MTKDELKKKWLDEGLLDDEGHFLPTFIEDVGSACAENVRSAALMRWAKRNNGEAREWLKSVLKKEVGTLCLAREVELGKVTHSSDSGTPRKHTCRIDLEFVPSETEGRVLAEVKWRAQPSIDQLEEYNKALEGKSESKIILLTPINVADNDFSGFNVVPAGWKRLPENVFPAIWSSLSKHLRRTAYSGLGSYEDVSLAATIGRWADLYEATEECVERRDVKGMIDLMEWMSEIAAPDDYIVLFKQLILAKLAEKCLELLGKTEWIRSDPSKGSNGSDVTVDLFHKTNSFSQIREMKGGYGVLVSLRLKIGLDHQNPVIEAQIGSAINPYGKSSEPYLSELKIRREKLRTIIRNPNFTLSSGRDKCSWRYSCSVAITQWSTYEDNLRCMAEYIHVLNEGLEGRTGEATSKYVNN